MIIYSVFALAGIALLVISLIFDDLIDGALDAGPDWLTGVGVGGFLATLGLAGLGGHAMGWSPTVTALVAALIAFGVAAAINAFALRVMTTGSERSMTAADLVGLSGTSILGAAAGSLGEVLITVGGHPLKVNGRCTEPLKAGDLVEVTAASSITSVSVHKTA